MMGRRSSPRTTSAAIHHVSLLEEASEMTMRVLVDHFLLVVQSLETNSGSSTAWRGLGRPAQGCRRHGSFKQMRDVLLKNHRTHKKTRT